MPLMKLTKLKELVLFLIYDTDKFLAGLSDFYHKSLLKFHMAFAMVSDE
jgi:hypothetical protein